MTDCRTFLGCLTVSTTASVKVIFFKDGTVSEDLRQRPNEVPKFELRDKRN